MVLVALLTATAIPLLFLLLIRALDLYGTGSPRAVAISFLWGAVAVFISFAYYRLNPGGLDTTSATLYVAPLIEETLKALPLIYLVRRPNFTYFVDGAIYGFAAGIGFAVFENYFYVFQSLDSGLSAALGRVLSTNLMHAGAGAIIGIALGRSRFQRFSGRFLHLVTGLFLAIVLHGAFNHLVTLSNSSVLFLYAVTVGFSAFAFTALTIRRGLAVEKKWIAEALGQSERVTAAEVSATGELRRVDALLKPLVTLFGAEKATRIEELLLMQAQLGILHKTHARAHQDPRAQAAIAEQIEQKQQDMEAVRRAIGSYTMVSLRMLFPQEGGPLWQRLQGRLAARAAQQSPADEPASLFALIQRRSLERREEPQAGDSNAAN